MKTVYHIQVVGGPWDGMDVKTSRFAFAEKQRLRLPASPVDERWDQAEGRALAESYGSAYLMIRKRCVRGNAAAVVHLKYGFLTFECLDPQIPNGQTSAPRHCWRKALANHLRRWHDALVRWMLSPVDYPLDIRRLN